ncbi:hypothetical protein GGR57DRAFT_506248 [Xylariaceae sp. FL1272]|nr:hypothetical protein GGR57DRAFT_506248 [Xylariaceae sp. FL1272]
MAQTKRFHCHLCQKLFNSEHALQAHKNDSPMHRTSETVSSANATSQTDQKTIQCIEKCGLAFTDKQRFIEHSTQTGHQRERVCTSCQKLFVNKEALRSHERSSPKHKLNSTITMLENASLSSRYPWVSPAADAIMLDRLNSLCLSPERMRTEGYPVGTPAKPKKIPDGSAKLKAAVERTYPRNPHARGAIVLDCEMVGVGVGGQQSELIRLCAVDFVVGEILIDALSILLRVSSTGGRGSAAAGTRVSGTVSPAGSREVLNGWPAARARLFEFIDAETVLVGHGLHFDLEALHMRHAHVVDSAVVTAEAVFGSEPGATLHRRWGLKALSQELLHLGIQKAAGGHDCVEDTLATRELVLLYLRQPQRLVEWAVIARETFEKERCTRSKVSKRKSKSESTKRGPMDAVNSEDSDDDFHNFDYEGYLLDAGYPASYVHGLLY